jgi:hypothetical protein
LAIRRDDAGESPPKALSRQPAQKFGLSGCDSIRKTHNLCSEPESACRYHTPASCLWTLPPRNSHIRLLIGRPGAPCMAPSDFPRHETHAQPQIEQSTPNDLRNTESRCRGGRRRVAAARHRGLLARASRPKSYVQGLGNPPTATWQHPSPTDDGQLRVLRMKGSTRDDSLRQHSNPEIRQEKSEQAALSDLQNTQMLPSQPYRASHPRRFPIHWFLWKPLCNRYGGPPTNLDAEHVRVTSVKKSDAETGQPKLPRASLGCRDIRHSDLQCPPHSFRLQ